MLPTSVVNVINILPRITKGKNDIIHELNRQIQNICNEARDRRLYYVDTESDHKLFTDNECVRREEFFVQDDRYTDNVHLNGTGIIRLGRHLKYLAHL